MSNLLEALRDQYATDKAAALNLLPELFQAEKDGLIIEVPCKAGTEVYRPVTFCDGTKLIAKGRIAQYSFMNDRKEFYFEGTEELRKYDCWYDLSLFGILVFLTRPEAERRLESEKHG